MILWAYLIGVVVVGTGTAWPFYRWRDGFADDGTVPWYVAVMGCAFLWPVVFVMLLVTVIRNDL